MSKVKGFTFVELIITLLVMSIMIALAIPSYQDFIADNRKSAAYNELVAAIAMTRSEAIKRSQQVTMCQSSTLSGCTKDSDQWHLGWVIFVDDNENNSIDKDELILRVQPPFSNIILAFGARTRIAYKASGIAVGGSNGTFLLCSPGEGKTLKGLIISITGRARKASVQDLAKKECPS